MSFSPPVTVGVFVLYIVIGLIWRIPLIARVGIQVGLGLVLYFAFSTAMFAMPYGDNLPMSDLYGGAGDPPLPFNKYSLGVLGTVLGIVFSLIGAAIGKVVGGKKDE